MAEVAAADQPQERELQLAQPRLLRDYSVPQEEEVQTPLAYNNVAAENFELKTQMIQWNNNWTNQQSNYQRSAQPSGFQNQPFRVKEEDLIKVGNVLASLDATVKNMQNQVAQMARRIPDRPAGTLPGDTLENSKRREAHSTNQKADMQHKESPKGRASESPQGNWRYGLIITLGWTTFYQRTWERKAIVEREVDILAYPYSDIIERGWQGFCTFAIKQNLTTIREFYSNLWGADEYEIVVRGKADDISRAAIRETLELPANIPLYEDTALDMMDETPERELPVALCEDAAEDIWTIDGQGFLKHFPTAELKQAYKPWFNFICTNLMLSNHLGVVTFDAVILLYAIAMNIPIDAADIIRRQMHRCLNLRQKYWFFPILATRLMMRAGVHFLPGDERGEIPTPWNVQGPPDSWKYDLGRGLSGKSKTKKPYGQGEKGLREKQGVANVAAESVRKSLESKNLSKITLVDGMQEIAARNWAVGRMIRARASEEILVEEGRLATDDHQLEESAAAHSIERKYGSCPAARLLL
ncbi:OLC1v1001284C1 [Oldenlandia corymbosa var. corymbosa]|uniref:OLC1v1001284C1 n=1 Tax=Oldenlandia corymbosa var. corymbosa TaxID=529605 RepID=A0AAV1D4Y9_OLDCO|nr:OLC1v1001284C1 [Oldenlandia corymbosa var. corymbosa]